MITSVGVDAILVVLTGWTALDSIVRRRAGGAEHPLVGVALMRDRRAVLMDEAVSNEILFPIFASRSRGAAGAIEAHDLENEYRRPHHLRGVSSRRSRKHERRGKAHDICDRVEAALKAEMSHEIRSTSSLKRKQLADAVPVI